MKRSNLFLLLFMVCLQQTAFAQPGWDEPAFRSMPPAGRFRFVHDYLFWKISSGSEQAALLGKMLAIAGDENDRRTVLALKYYMCLASGNQGFVMPEGKTGAVYFTEMETEAKELGYEVEEVVAHHYLTGNLVLTHEQRYVEVHKTFERMEAVGFEKFRDYGVEAILFTLNQFLWELEDYEKAFQYLSVAERFIQPTEEGGHFYTQVLSYLQTYWKQKMDFGKSIEYVQKILRFHQNFKTDSPEAQWWNRFWKGFANIEMAALYLEQGDMGESEQFADQGYELSKAADSVGNAPHWQAEFEALQVLIEIKLKLGKLDEAAALLQRSQFIREKLEPLGQLDYFKPLKLYRHFSKYHEMRGNAAAALRYTRLAQTLQDSLDRRNDARQLAQVQRRMDAEKFQEKISLIENEKQFQVLLRNAAIAIFLLTLTLGWAIFSRIREKRRLAEAELRQANERLDVLKTGLLEKSAIVERMSAEIEKIAALDEREKLNAELSRHVVLTNEDWSHFRSIFERVHPGFIEEQVAQTAGLTAAELRLVVFEKLGLSDREIANLLGISEASVRQTRWRLRKKANV